MHGTKRLLEPQHRDTPSQRLARDVAPRAARGGREGIQVALDLSRSSPTVRSRRWARHA